MLSHRSDLGTRVAICLATVLALAGLLICDVGQNAVASSTSEQTFAAGQPWGGEFADPSILQVGQTYWAYATVGGGDNVPAEHTDDLDGTWYLRDAYPASSNPGWWAGYNDVLPHPASWAYYGIVRNGRRFTNPWAPSVLQVGRTFVMAYSVARTAANPARRCISIATASSPAGPFVDRSSEPIACSSDTNGSTDPQVFRAITGRLYLIWKNAGVKGHRATAIRVRELNAAGTAFLPGSVGRQLLTTAQPWEGSVIEGPDMIRYGGRYYLFYAGNSWASSSYAIGYAICRTVLGPCVRASSRPLLATGGQVAGPGSPAPTVGPAGALRLGYAAWDYGHVGYGDPSNHRRMHVARLTVDAHGLLHVATRG